MELSVPVCGTNIVLWPTDAALAVWHAWPSSDRHTSHVALMDSCPVVACSYAYSLASVSIFCGFWVSLMQASASLALQA